MMEQMRERVARAIGAANLNCDPVGIDPDEWQDEADAALSLMQPEIDRRVAEEKAKLLGRFDEDDLEQIISDSLDMDWLPRHAARAIRQAMITAFQQENSDATTDR